MLIRKPMRKGQTIRRKEIRMGERDYTPQTYTVVKDYPHHVVVEDQRGIKRSITHADLLSIGIVKQPANIECWRK